jgi:hypothetical protein
MDHHKFFLTFNHGGGAKAAWTSINLSSTPNGWLVGS